MVTAHVSRKEFARSVGAYRSHHRSPNWPLWLHSAVGIAPHSQTRPACKVWLWVLWGWRCSSKRWIAFCQENNGTTLLTVTLPRPRSAFKQKGQFPLASFQEQAVSSSAQSTFLVLELARRNPASRLQHLFSRRWIDILSRMM